MTQRRIYQEEFPYFITFRTTEGYPLFEQTKYAESLSREIFISAKIKYFDVLSYQIMPDHAHLLTCKTDRTLENVRSEPGGYASHIHAQSTLSRVRLKKSAQSRKKSYTISDLMQSIKGNFLWKIHDGNIWQRRFYTRIINTNEYLDTVIEYIKQNPVKENLPRKYHKMPYQYFDWWKIRNLI